MVLSAVGKFKGVGAAERGCVEPKTGREASTVARTASVIIEIKRIPRDKVQAIHPLIKPRCPRSHDQRPRGRPGSILISDRLGASTTPLNHQAERTKSGPSTPRRDEPGVSRFLPCAHESPEQPEKRSPHQGTQDRVQGDHDPDPRHRKGERDQHPLEQTHQKHRESKRTPQRPFIEIRRKIRDICSDTSKYSMYSTRPEAGTGPIHASRVKSAASIARRSASSGGAAYRWVVATDACPKRRWTASKSRSAEYAAVANRCRSVWRVHPSRKTTAASLETCAPERCPPYFDGKHQPPPALHAATTARASQSASGTRRTRLPFP